MARRRDGVTAEAAVPTIQTGEYRRGLGLNLIRISLGPDTMSLLDQGVTARRDGISSTLCGGRTLTQLRALPPCRARTGVGDNSPRATQFGSAHATQALVRCGESDPVVRQDWTRADKRRQAVTYALVRCGESDPSVRLDFLPAAVTLSNPARRSPPDRCFGRMAGGVERVPLAPPPAASTFLVRDPQRLNVLFVRPALRGGAANPQ